MVCLIAGMSCPMPGIRCTIRLPPYRPFAFIPVNRVGLMMNHPLYRGYLTTVSIRYVTLTSETICFSAKKISLLDISKYVTFK